MVDFKMEDYSGLSDDELVDEILDEYERNRSEQISDGTGNSVRQQDGLTKGEKTNKIHLTRGQKTGILYMFGGSLLVLAGLINYQNYKRTERVNRQVKEYEKTLPPEYLEYKQAVEYYRDSLISTYGL